MLVQNVHFIQYVKFSILVNRKNIYIYVCMSCGQWFILFFLLNILILLVYKILLFLFPSISRHLALLYYTRMSFMVHGSWHHGMRCCVSKSSHMRHYFILLEDVEKCKFFFFFEESVVVCEFPEQVVYILTKKKKHNNLAFQDECSF